MSEDPNTPRVSVIMAVYNGERYLDEAVESILKQTFTDFEFIIVDDGSTDGSGEIIEKYAASDSRIRLIRHENIGLAKSLNRGLREARGEFIARMDADDVSTPHRLGSQVDRFNSDPSLSILSSWVNIIDEQGNEIGEYQFPLTDSEIRWWMLFGNPFSHPATMLRKAHLQSYGLNYDESFETCQDYDLWQRLLVCGKGANLKDVLVSYRRHESAVGARHGLQQRKTMTGIQTRVFLSHLQQIQCEISDRDDWNKQKLEKWCGFSAVNALPILVSICKSLDLSIDNRWIGEGFELATSELLNPVEKARWNKLRRLCGHSFSCRSIPLFLILNAGAVVDRIRK